MASSLVTCVVVRMSGEQSLVKPTQRDKNEEIDEKQPHTKKSDTIVGGDGRASIVFMHRDKGLVILSSTNGY